MIDNGLNIRAAVICEVIAALSVSGMSIPYIKFIVAIILIMRLVSPL